MEPERLKVRSCRGRFYEIAKLYGCTAGVDVKRSEETGVERREAR
jgi:hypothetical protein